MEKKSLAGEGPSLGARGRPRHCPTDDSRALVRRLVAAGRPVTAIAAALDLSPPTLRVHYLDELAAPSRAFAPRPPVPGVRWYALQLRRRWEPLAFEVLKRRGFDPFIPLERVERKHGRQAPRIIDAPTLPGWGFVRLDLRQPGWHQLFNLPLVIRLVTTGEGTPVPIAEADIARLRNKKPGADPRTIMAIPKDTPVEFLEGAWADHRGVCLWSDDKRARFAMSLFGRSVTVEAPISAVRVVTNDAETPAPQRRRA